MQMQTPTFGVMRPLAQASERIRKGAAVLSNDRDRSGTQSVGAVAIYDLSINPMTFDFAIFLVAAERYFLTHGMKTFTLVILQRTKQSAADSASNGKQFGEDEEAWRLYNVIVPVANSCLTCDGFSILSSQTALGPYLRGKLVFPEGFSSTYRPVWNYADAFSGDLPPGFHGFRSLQKGRAYVEQWKVQAGVSGPYVVVTLRQRGNDQLRNSDIAVWVEFAEWVAAQGYLPVFVPDTESGFEVDARLRGFAVFQEAAWNIHLRLALYESAFLSYFNSNGPAALAFGSRDCRSISFSPLIPDSIYSNVEALTRAGLHPESGRQEFRSGMHIFVFKTPSLENLCDEFTRFD